MGPAGNWEIPIPVVVAGPAPEEVDSVAMVGFLQRVEVTLSSTEERVELTMRKIV